TPPRKSTEYKHNGRPYRQGGQRDDFKYEVNRLAIVHKHSKDLGNEAFDKYDKLHQTRLALERKKPAGPTDALCVTEMTPRETFVLLRGNPQARGDKVTPGFPSVLPETRPAVFTPRPDSKTSRRRRV